MPWFDNNKGKTPTQNGTSADAPATAELQNVSLLIRPNDEIRASVRDRNAFSDTHIVLSTDDQRNNENIEERVARRRKTLSVRWVILALLSFSMGCNHFCLDEPASLISNFGDWVDEDSKTFQTHFNMLFTMYSIPNIIITLFGGMFVSQYGAWRMLIIFSMCLFIGQFIFAVGVHSKSWPIMFIGRFVYGLGGENMYTSKSVLLARWFPENQLALAFGIGLSFARFGTVASDSLSPILANSTDLSVAIYVGFFITMAIMLASLVIGRIEVNTERKLSSAKESSKALIEALLGGQTSSIRNLDNDDIVSHCSNGSINSHRTTSVGSEVDITLSHAHSSDLPCIGDLFHLKLASWVLAGTVTFIYGCVVPYNIAASGILLERNYFKNPPSECQLLLPDQCISGSLEPVNGNPSFDSSGRSCPGSKYAPVLPSSLNISKDITQWGENWEEGEYVFDLIESSDVNCADSFWADACAKNYCDERGDAAEKAGVMMSIPFIIGAFASPFLGFFADTYGHRLSLSIFACVSLGAAHLIFAFDDESPALPLVFQGTGFSIFVAVIFPMIALITEPRYLGISYGLIACSQNISMSLFPLIVAMLYNLNDSYLPNVELFFTSSAACGLILSLYLTYMDTRDGGRLNKPASNDIDEEETEDYQERVLLSDDNNIRTQAHVRLQEL